jgi:hypothetical protein
MKKIYSFFVFLFFFSSVFYGQECGTPTPDNYQTYEENDPQNQTYSNSTSSSNYCYKINVFFRNVTNDNGTNGNNPANFSTMIDQLNLSFFPHNISFVMVGYDTINSTALNYFNNQVTAVPARIPNALNIFIVKQITYQGRDAAGLALATPSNTCLIRSPISLETLCHEIGHCLNLLHTHQCSFRPYIPSCAENPDGSNCLTAGDRICDTPADFYYIQDQDVPGTNYGLSLYAHLYNPDFNNFMGYHLDRPFYRFTLGQGQRMRAAIQNAPVLQPLRSNECASFIGNGTICSGEEYTFEILNAFGNPVTYSWSVGSNLEIVGSSTNSSVVIKTTNNQFSGTSTISVAINGITRTRTLRIGYPVRPNNSNIAGLFDWVPRDGINRGLVAPTNSTITSYFWTLEQDPDQAPVCPTTGTATTAVFAGSNSNEFSSSSPSAVVNWGTCSGSYLLSCWAVNDCGMTLLRSKFVDVGDPSFNPCEGNIFSFALAPNPLQGNSIRILLGREQKVLPCLYKIEDIYETFNKHVDKIENSVFIFDFNGNLVKQYVIDKDDFIMDEINFNPGNYIVNLYTKDNEFSQQVLIVESK